MNWKRATAATIALLCSAMMAGTACALATGAHAGSDDSTVLNGTLSHFARWATALVLLAVASLIVTDRRAKLRGDTTPIVKIQIKPTHFLPAAIQVVIYGYWALYWRDLVDLLPMIGWQLVWAFAFDCLLRLWRTGRWTIGIGPVPIVLSANLVALFAPVSWVLAVAMVSLALLSRDLLRFRGRHIFNPSAFGVSMIGLLNLFWPALGYSDRAHEFNLAPNMTEVVVLAALVVQVRLPVVLSTLGAALSLYILQQLGLHVLSPAWAPVTLILLLFLTDPATIPASPTGRFFFGLLAGLLMGCIGHGLELATYSDFYAKVLAVPLTNLATPALIRFAAYCDQRWSTLPRMLSPRFNGVHMALWLVFVTTLLFGGQKSERFSHGRTALQLENQTPCLTTRDGIITCENNRLYCQPLRFDLELRCWLK